MTYLKTTGHNRPRLILISLLIIFATACALQPSTPVGNFKGVCARTPEVKNAIMSAAAASPCQDVTIRDMTTIEHLTIRTQALKAGDLSNMPEIISLDITLTAPTNEERRKGIIDGAFRGLSDLEELELTNDTNTKFPVTKPMLAGMPKLEAFKLVNPTSITKDALNGFSSSLIELTLHTNKNPDPKLSETLLSRLIRLHELEFRGFRNARSYQVANLKVRCASEVNDWAFGSRSKPQLAVGRAYYDFMESYTEEEDTITCVFKNINSETESATTIPTDPRREEE